jgi:hypothetical protein
LNIVEIFNGKGITGGGTAFRLGSPHKDSLTKQKHKSSPTPFSGIGLVV